MKEKTSALDRVCIRFVGAFFFGVPVSLIIISAVGLTNEIVDFGLNEIKSPWWIYATMILCIGFGFIFNAMDRLADLVKTKVDDEREKGEK